ncbi:hypothetical protein HYH03_016452 [Edaphochlamys debaryana]|uniref:Sulfatase N-terminal domain-containing protein n=1 Tax=Edaphochlamys debaryana TaxID=47281 RepID=A0A835XJW9_9CHLO|nr:hypothetical protein HYH03_016452 [Edaphochlamys debaryana]|eukprot:KAG2484799.1 hypothetical protein HYH03_016452 [Edaphochlamys debaryana]
MARRALVTALLALASSTALEAKEGEPAMPSRHDLPPPGSRPTPSPPPSRPIDPPRPNFVVILTDDQDDLLNSTHPHFMPALDKHLRQQGTRLSNFVVSTGVCCPARVSLHTGRLAHCTNVTVNYNDAKLTGGGPAAGGFRKFYEQRLDMEWLPALLAAGGYDIYLLGKLLNEYYENATFLAKGKRYVPRGVKHIDALTYRPYDLYGSCWSLNGAPSVCLKGQYQTDVLRDKALDLISSTLASSPRPFLLVVAPTAPHRECLDPQGKDWTPPRPADRHKDLYTGEGVSLPRGPNYGRRNPAQPRGQSGQGEAAYAASGEALYLARLRALRAVDELVEAVVEALRNHGLLSTTHVVFASDNGYHIGAFRLRDGKNLPIEEDVRVPFLIRGPNIPAGAVLPYQGNMVDVAPTLLALAGLPIPSSMDGLPLPLSPALAEAHRQALGGARQRDTNILEGWNGERLEGTELNKSLHYKALRVCTEARLLPPSKRTDLAAEPDHAARSVLAPGARCYKYIVWCQGPRELYDLSTDPYEVENRISEVAARILDRVDAVLSALVHCSGAGCRNPYRLLHPDGAVDGFAATLEPKYDRFYGALQKLSILLCNVVYLPYNELTWTQQYQQHPAGAGERPGGAPQGSPGAGEQGKGQQSPRSPFTEVRPPPHKESRPPMRAV